jgi:hypothetical protein
MRQKVVLEVHSQATAESSSSSTAHANELINGHLGAMLDRGETGIDAWTTHLNFLLQVPPRVTNPPRPHKYNKALWRQVKYVIKMNCPRTSNQERAKWRTECREKLANHIRECTRYIASHI